VYGAELVDCTIWIFPNGALSSVWIVNGPSSEYHFTSVSCPKGTRISGGA